MSKSINYFKPNVKKFRIGNVRKIIKEIYEEIFIQVPEEFPKSEDRLISYYQYKERRIHFYPDGTVRGGNIRIIFSLIDFSFVRNILSSCYSNLGASCYDPVTMFLLEIIKLWDGYKDYALFYKDLKDDFKGKRYREWIGIKDKIPDQSDMCNFRKRIGEEYFQSIMTLLVYLFQQVGIITGETMCTDGTLLPSFGNFRDCNYMNEGCNCIQCPKNIFNDYQEKINQTVEEMKKEDKSAKILKMEIQCPKPEIIEKMKKALLSKKKTIKSEEVGSSSIFKIKIIRNPKEGLENHLEYIKKIIKIDITIPDGYGIQILSSSLSLDEETGKIIYNCPKASKDKDARTGYRRNPRTGKTEAIFGYKSVIITSVEKYLGLELPIMLQTGEGNINEAKTFIEVHKKLKKYNAFETKYHIMDSGYDYEYVYEYVREEEGIPIIDYNYRNEKLKEKKLIDRGYDELGRPYAPCGTLCKENGYDSKRKTIKYICSKNCKNCDSCEHNNKKYGYTKSLSIKENPRLFIEIPRSSEKFTKIKDMRSSSERTNGYAKDYTGLGNIRLWGKNAYAVRAAMVCITVLLKKITEFILKITLYEKNYIQAVKIYGFPKKEWMLKETT